jgi:hypothetical protein
MSASQVISLRAKLLPEAFDSLLESIYVRIVFYDHISFLCPLRYGGLGLDAGLSLLFCKSLPAKAIDYFSLRRYGNPYLVYEISPPGLDEQCGFQNYYFNTLTTQALDFLPYNLMHQRMHNTVKPLQRLGIIEYKLSQFAAVYLIVTTQDALAKGGHYFAPCLGVRTEGFMSYFIGIYHYRSQFREHPRYSALAAGDSAGKADDHHIYNLKKSPSLQAWALFEASFLIASSTTQKQLTIPQKAYK